VVEIVLDAIVAVSMVILACVYFLDCVRVMPLYMPRDTGR
jgi:hypothetical protein